MTRRQVLVQLDDDLVARLDHLDSVRGTNRSALLRLGAVALLEAADEAEADRRLIESYERTPQDAELVEAAARMAARTAPAW